ncbi:MAG: class I SAM-dependent methyltransferase [Chloroflexota bacterium]
MTIETFNFIDYLAAKKSVDDRALNRLVLQRLNETLATAAPNTPLQVLEIAAGIGTMLERLIDWNILVNTTYTLIDLEPSYIAEAQRRLPRWAESQGFQVDYVVDQTLVFHRDQQRIEIHFEAVDIFEFMAREQGSERWDLLIGHAFLDLADIPTLFTDLFSLLKPEGLVYFSINFDGETILLPDIDPVLDKEIIDLYHGVMDEHQVNDNRVGGSQTGRALFKQLTSAGVSLIEVGSSDWVVYPGPNGYLDNEAYFLHCIIDTIEATLSERASFDIQPWLAHRHAQIEQNELIYIAHQLDFLGKINDRTSA